MTRCEFNSLDASGINIRRDRRGVTMLEVISAMAVLATLIGVSAELLTLARAQRRSAVQRRLAMVEAENALENLAAAQADVARLDTGLDDLALAPHAANLLPDGRITARAERSHALDDGATVGYQLSVEVSWQLPSGQSAAPVRLTTWVYPRDEAVSTDTVTEVEP